MAWASGPRDETLPEAMVTTTRDRVAISRFSFEMADPKHLNHLLAAVRRIDGVYDAYRVTSGA